VLAPNHGADTTRTTRAGAVLVDVPNNRTR
jgi:hypothetical protein